MKCLPQIRILSVGRYLKIKIKTQVPTEKNTFLLFFTHRPISCIGHLTFQKQKSVFLTFGRFFCYCSRLIPSLVYEIPLPRCLFLLQFKILSSGFSTCLV